MAFLRISFILTTVFSFFSCNNDNMDSVPAVSIENIQVEEGSTNNNLEITLTLTNAVDYDLSVDARTADGTAVKGNDYTNFNEVVVFTAGQQQSSFNIEIIGDDTPEDNEIFSIRLENPVNVTIDNRIALVTILNDDEHIFSIPETGYSTPETYEGMTLVWSDEFDGSSINTSNWSFEIGTGNWGWGNNELQYYQEDNSSIINGNLVIEARKESIENSNYTSSRLITRDKKSFRYGRVDIRAVMPEGQGIWPALWMLGSNHFQVGWPTCGEIDIMEMIGGGNGRDNVLRGTAHWNQGGHVSYGQGYTNESYLSNEYHVYSIIWDEQNIRWYFDDINYNTMDITPAQLSAFHNNFYFIMNIAVGGEWPGSPDNSTLFPQWMIIDYIRVFQEL
ncbi:MAG: family 16 glycosylhydrolase [Candidatus Neomarinimicrobiota bacterium]|nr:MAG: glycosyl hydrolase family protein [bacterium]